MVRCTVKDRSLGIKTLPPTYCVWIQCRYLLARCHVTRHVSGHFLDESIRGLEATRCYAIGSGANCSTISPGWAAELNTCREERQVLWGWLRCHPHNCTRCKRCAVRCAVVRT